MADPRGRAGQFHYDLVIMRQYVIVGTEAATEAAPAEADSPSRREVRQTLALRALHICNPRRTAPPEGGVSDFGFCFHDMFCNLHLFS